MRAGTAGRRWLGGDDPVSGAAGRPGPGGDRGSASVWSLGAIAVLCVVFGAVLALGQAAVVRHRAAGGADLAALAAADHWPVGEAEACALADRVARAQGARLVRCAVVGEIADVAVASGGGPFTAEVRARAGPPGPPGSVGDGSAPVVGGAAPGVVGPTAHPGPAPSGPPGGVP